MRREFVLTSIFLSLTLVVVSLFFPIVWWSFVVVVPLIALGYRDYFQTSHTINRIFPLIGHFRYILEDIRPEINQYFIESNHDGRPISREQRAVVYQRAKGVLDTIPFGTQKDVYNSGYEWICHSLNPKHVDPKDLRVMIGSNDCTQPYNASLLNIAAMSYGSLSKTAVLALNHGARMGDFAHNTGEGGISSYHKEPGGDLIWQLGTAYFGCRTLEGRFDADTFADKIQDPQIKMVEIKLSQGAKPGHGGILPGAKVNKDIAEARGVPIGKDVISPPAHPEFSTPIELLEFIARLRRLSNGKPIGFKMCIGKRHEFIAICKAMLETGIKPDFIVVDGGEGGTGAAPLEYTNHIGEPGVDAQIFVQNMLTGFGVRDEIKIIATGKITDAFDMVKRLSLGADLMYSARGMMLALGCIQALRCNTNFCPTGVATQDPNLYDGLVVEDKKTRVKQFHENTLQSLAEIIGSMGLRDASRLRPWHVKRRINLTRVQDYFSLYHFLEKGQLLNEETIPEEYLMDYFMANPNTFVPDINLCKSKLNLEHPELANYN